MIIQSSYSQAPGVALPGQLVDAMSPTRRGGRAARGLIKAGYMQFKPAVLGNAGASGMLDPGQCFHIPNPGAGADVDAIKTSFTSTATIQTFTSAHFDGVVGATEMQPARKITLVLSNHTDWDATTAVLTGVNHLGQSVSENLSIPDGGNTTLTSTNSYRSVTSLVIPAQTDVNGTATVGIAALDSLGLIDMVGVSIRKEAKTSVSSNGLYGYPGVTSSLVEANYVDGEPVSLLNEGGIWVFTEEAVSDRDPVYARVAAGAGGSMLGAFRNDAEGGNCVLVPDARFCRDAAAGVAWAYFRHVG